MRKSQWETFNEETLLSYLEDLNSKNNPLFQKYAQMMKYNSPEEYEKIKDIFQKESSQDWWEEMNEEEQQDIEVGLKEAQNDRVKSHQDVMKLFDEWK